MKKVLLVLSVFLLFGMSVFPQDWSLDPSYGDLHLESGFDPDPHYVEILAGGSIDLSEVTIREIRRLRPNGFIADAPDLDFYFETDGFLPLIIRVDGFGDDTVLLINDPSDNWHFNDDGDEGVDPVIIFETPESGLYSIWVGTYWDDDLVDVDLIISEIE